MRSKRRLTLLERASIAVIGAGVVLLGARQVLARTEPTGPIYSTDQLIAALDAAGIAHHTNPRAVEVDKPDDCSLLEEADRKHVRQIRRTQVQVGPDDTTDVDLVITGFDTGSRAAAKLNSRRSTATAGGWLALQNGNLYVELQAPAAAFPDLAAKLRAATTQLITPATPTPPLLRC